LFISHGTVYEAFKSNQLKTDFDKLRNAHIKKLPSAIVLFSGHWQTETILVTTNPKMVQLDEGFPSEFQTNYATVGNIELSNQIIQLIIKNGIGAKVEKDRGLDHGALIPLMLLFPNHNIPVVQISQQLELEPQCHKEIAEILSPLQQENIIFIGSGGLVHNRNEIQKFGGHEILPDAWVKEFDDFITH